MMDNIFIILLSYIFVLFIIIKFLYNVIGPKLYFPFRLAEIFKGMYGKYVNLDVSISEISIKFSSELND